MILLLGGTRETTSLSAALAELGEKVLVSTASDFPLQIAGHENILRRSGELDEDSLAELIVGKGITMIVDATHPYAANIRRTAQAVAERMGVKYFGYIRPPAAPTDGCGAIFAADHQQAARLAFSFGKNVLLTTGANNLAPYVQQAAATGATMFVRILPREQSRTACRDAGIPPERIIAEQGPFTVEQNREHIRLAGAGVVVTKDGGQAGGLEEKLRAAELENCQTVIVRRPVLSNAGYFDDLQKLIKSVRKSCMAD